jgi:glycosyltransferase involved in cell wall biosynthesis
LKNKGKVSIIFPTLNSEHDLPRLLDSLLPLKNKVEVIAVDSCSDDKTIELLKQYTFPKIVTVPPLSSKGKARNEGIKNAAGDIIVNIDSDVEILPGWYEALMESMEHADIVAGYSPDPRGKHLPRVPIFVDGQDISFPACNIAYKKSVFDTVGLFNEIQNLPEDIDLNYRCVKARYKIQYDPTMKLHHYQRKTIPDFIRQAFWNGEARWELNRLHPELRTLHEHGLGVKNLCRLGFGFLGYTIGKLYRLKGEKV